MSCDFCDFDGEYEIRGIRLCRTHYIEALEHGADLTFDACGVVPDDADVIGIRVDGSLRYDSVELAALRYRQAVRNGIRPGSASPTGG